MADGIQFYKNKKYSGFNECEETIQFTLRINYLFDALNRKFPAEGIKPKSQDLEVSLCCFMCCMYKCCFCDL